MSPREPASKILSRAQVLERFGRPRTSRVVFTNGCFDLLHPGHVEYLAQARALGDALVVALNTDASVRRLKGPGRPLVALEDRALVVAALEAVDAVTAFHEDTPRELIAALLPDVLVKGGDYRLADIVGRDEVAAAGGETVVLPFRAGHSTTELVNRIREGQG
ncbi:MAG TPA: D-glycero-beta-D-manno-heptose 1-phosphate adenylyltransferase [Longimicrobiales bacterium]|nr:D-glycero-beta-D-manno-heptose 1-phosphate adenylyltransferase [Longimicrobiales bacterium]